METSVMTPKQKHINALEQLARHFLYKIDGEKVNQALQKLEKRTHHLSEAYCNGEITNSRWSAHCSYVKKRVADLFGFEIPGFFVNGDPRGHALKIDDNVERNLLQTHGIYFQRDWGGYALLAPEL